MKAIKYAELTLFFALSCAAPKKTLVPVSIVDNLRKENTFLKQKNEFLEQELFEVKYNYAPCDSMVSLHYEKIPPSEIHNPKYQRFNHKLPILMYHSVNDNLEWRYNIHTDKLKDHFNYLAENGYTSLFFSDITNGVIPEKSVILTFDDGYKNFYTSVFPLLKKYQLKATLFVIVGHINTEPSHCTWAELREMQNSGMVDVQPHSMSHLGLGRIKKGKTDFNSIEAKSRLEFEVSTSKLTLEKYLGIERIAFALPYGDYASGTYEAVYRAGFRYIILASAFESCMCLGTCDGNYQINNFNSFAMSRAEVQSVTTVKGLRKMLGEK